MVGLGIVDLARFRLCTRAEDENVRAPERARFGAVGGARRSSAQDSPEISPAYFAFVHIGASAVPAMYQENVKRSRGRRFRLAAIAL